MVEVTLFLLFCLCNFLATPTVETRARLAATNCIQWFNDDDVDEKLHHRGEPIKTGLLYERV